MEDKLGLRQRGSDAVKGHGHSKTTVKDPVEYGKRLAQYRDAKQKERQERLEKIEKRKQELKDRRKTCAPYNTKMSSIPAMKPTSTEPVQKNVKYAMVQRHQNRFSLAFTGQGPSNSNNEVVGKGSDYASCDQVKVGTSHRPTANVPLRSNVPKRHSLPARSMVKNGVCVSTASIPWKENVHHLQHGKKVNATRLYPLVASDKINCDGVETHDAVVADVPVLTKSTNVNIDGKTTKIIEDRRSSFTISLKRKAGDPPSTVPIKQINQEPAQSSNKAAAAAIRNTKQKIETSTRQKMSARKLSRLRQLSLWREQQLLKASEKVETAKATATGKIKIPAVIMKSGQSSVRPLSAISNRDPKPTSLANNKPVNSSRAAATTLSGKAKSIDGKSMGPISNIISKKVVPERRTSSNGFKGAIGNAKTTAARYNSVKLVTGIPGKGSCPTPAVNKPRSSTPRKLLNNPQQGSPTATPMCSVIDQQGMRSAISTPWTLAKTPGSLLCAKTPAVVTWGKVAKTPGGVSWTVKTPATKNRLTPAFRQNMTMREKLDNWLTAHGKSSTSYRHIACFGLHIDRHHRHRGSVAMKQLPCPSNPVSMPPIIECDDRMKTETVDGFQTDLLAMLKECLALMQSARKLTLSLNVHAQANQRGMTVLEAIWDDLPQDALNLAMLVFQKRLQECIQGFPSQHLMSWLDDVAAKIPSVHRTACFWTSRARLTAASGALQDLSQALAALDEGMASGAQPVCELEAMRTELLERAKITKELESSHSAAALFQRISAEVQRENVFVSSAIKYCVKRFDVGDFPMATPQKTPHRRITVTTPVSSCQNLVTPVRRSTRKSCAYLPAGLRDHDIIVESLDELPAERRKDLKFTTNVALALEGQFEPSPSATSFSKCRIAEVTPGVIME